jgi:hypothetical protein
MEEYLVGCLILTQSVLVCMRQAGSQKELVKLVSFGRRL